MTVSHFDTLDLFYRTLCAVMYNYVPLSGHPGGSISSGRFVMRLLFDAMDYDLARPERRDADIVSYAAGHKALGLYALWALRNEVARLAAPELLPADEKFQLRFEDLLGFRRNPSSQTPLFWQAAGQGAGWPSHAGDPVCATFHRRFRRGPARLAWPCLGRGGSLRSGCAKNPHHRG